MNNYHHAHKLIWKFRKSHPDGGGKEVKVYRPKSSKSIMKRNILFFLGHLGYWARTTSTALGTGINITNMSHKETILIPCLLRITALCIFKVGPSDTGTFISTCKSFDCLIIEECELYRLLCGGFPQDLQVCKLLVLR